MDKTRNSIRWLLFFSLAVVAGPVQAQLSGHNTKGDFGLQSGSQAPPGWASIAFTASAPK